MTPPPLGRAFLFALALVGCASPVGERLVEPELDVATPRPFVTDTTLSWRIVIDPNVPAWRAEVTRQALRDWERSVSCPVSFEVVRGPTTAVDYMSSTPAPPAPPSGTIEIRMVHELPDQATGWAEWFGDSAGRLGARLAFRDADNAADFRRVARHELGHAFWLPHNDEEPSLMRSTGCDHAEIMPADVRTFDALWCGR